MQAEILSVLSADGVGESKYLAGVLRRECRLGAHVKVQAQPQAVTEAIEIALEKCDILFITAPQDEAVQSAIWKKLQCRSDALSPDAVTLSAPASGEKGYAVPFGDQTVVVLPHRDRDQALLVQQSLWQYLQRFGKKAGASATVGLFGLTEQAVSRRIADLLCSEDPAVTMYYANG